MALVLLGSILTPLAETTCPRNSTSLVKNSHLVNLAVRWLSCKIRRTVSMWVRWVRSSGEWIRISSINTSTKSRWPKIRVTRR
eukprot:55059-Rhodomonas_salina.1